MIDTPLPTARDWMRDPVLVMAPDEPVFSGVDGLLSAGVATAPVVQEGRLVGIFTEKDALRAISGLLYDESIDVGTIGDHMSAEFESCSPDMDFFRVAELFLGCHFPTLPVVDGDRLVGVVERRALLACVDDYRRKLDSSRTQIAEAAGTQSDRPRGIEARQHAAAHTTREQLVRLFSRRKN